MAWARGHGCVSLLIHPSDSTQSSPRRVTLGCLCGLKGLVRDAGEERGGAEAASFPVRLQQSFLLLPLCLETSYVRKEKGMTPERQGIYLPASLSLSTYSPVDGELSRGSSPSTESRWCHRGDCKGQGTQMCRVNGQKVGQINPPALCLEIILGGAS